MKKEFTPFFLCFVMLFSIGIARSQTQVFIPTGRPATEVFSTTPGGFMITYGMLDKPLNQITFGAAHNCYSNNEDHPGAVGEATGYIFHYGTELNHDLSLDGQFKAGANIFDFDPTKYSVSLGFPWVVRHGPGIGFRPLLRFYNQLRNVIAANPNTVFILEMADLREGDGGEQSTEVSINALNIYKDAGLLGYTYNARAFYDFSNGTSTRGSSNLQNWLDQRGGYPTLREMISSGQNVFLVGPFYAGWQHTVQAGDETSAMGGANSRIAGAVSPASGNPATYKLPQLEFIPDDKAAGDRDIARDLNAGERVYQISKEIERQLNINSPNKEYALSSIQLDFLKTRSTTDYNVADACNRLNFERFGWDYFGTVSNPMYRMPKGLLIKPQTVNLGSNALTYTSYGFNENAVADQDLYSAVLVNSGGTVTYDFGAAAHTAITSWGAAFKETSKSMTVHVSNNNSTWTEVTGVQRTRLANQCWTIWDGSRNITERYVRFTLNNNESQLYEIACFNKNMTSVEAVPCPVPTTLNSSNISPSGVTLSWATVSGAQSYAVEYKPTTPSTSTWVSAGAALTNTSVVLTNLTAATTYDWRVRTNCNAATTGATNSVYVASQFTTISNNCELSSAPTVGAITINSATISWPAGTNAQSYNVQLGLSLTTLSTVATGVTGTSYTFTGLAPSTSYIAAVVPVCTFATGIGHATPAFTTLSLSSICPTLSAPQIADAYLKARSIIISWQQVIGATSYSVEYSSRNANTWVNVAAATPNLSVEVTGLLSGVQYDFRVRANCSAGNTTTSPWTTFTLFTSSCMEPSNLATSAITANAATVSWTVASGGASTPANYEVQYQPAISNIATPWITVAGSTTATSVRITGLTAGTAYKWRVKTSCTSNSSSYTIGYFNTHPACYNAFEPNNSGETAIALPLNTLLTAAIEPNAERTPGFDADYYTFATVGSGDITVRVFNAPIGMDLVLTLTNNQALGVTRDGNDLYVTVTNQPAGTYRLRLFVLDRIVTVPECYSFSITSNAVAPCNAPSGLSSSGVSSSGATVNWGAVSGATNYTVEYKTSAATTWTTASASTTNTSVNLTGLTASTVYNWRVMTNCISSSSSLAQAQFTTGAAPVPCNAPSGLSSSSVSSSGATVSWAAVSGATNYTVEYKTSAATTWTTASASTTATSVNITSLTASTVYDWRVRTNCASGSSGNTQAQFTTSTAASNCVTAYEANESQATAATIAPSTNITAGIGSNGDIDYYSFVVSSTSNFNIIMSNVPATQDYDLHLYNGSGTQIGSSTAGTGASETIALSNQPAGTYYVRVIGYNGAFNSTLCYTLNAGVTAVGPTCNAPSLVPTSGANNSNVITVSWLAVSGAASYDVDYKLASATTWISAAAATTLLSVNISGLTASTTYDCRLRTNCATGSSGYTQLQVTTPSASCSPPSSLNSSGVGNTSATVGWLAVSGASNYEVYYKPVSVTNWGLAAVVTVPTNSANLSGLTGSTVYDWRVRTLCPGGGSSAYVVSQFSTSATSCTAPSNLTASGISSSGATLGWTAVSGAENYDVDYKLSSSANWVSAASGTVNSTINLGSLSASSGYDWRVRTNCTSGSSGYVQAQFATTSSPSGCVNAYEPNELQGTAVSMAVNTPISAGIGSNTDIDYYSFAVTGTSNISITLSNVPATQDYDLYLYNGSGTQIGSSRTGTGASETIALSNLSPGTYYIRVIGYNGAFNTTLCYTLNAGVTPVGGTACTAPGGLSSSEVTSSSATVSWSSAAGALNYTVEYKPTSSANWTTAQTSTTSTSTALSGLSLSTLYDWRVRANCSGGSSTYAQAQFGTLGASACAAPAGLAVAAISNTGASLSWTPVSGAVSYNLDFKTASSTNWISGFVNITSNTVPLTGLNSSTLYDWRVRANCSGGSSVFSQSQLTTTAAAVSCASPSGLSASAISSTSATVNWTPVSNFWYYLIEYKRTTEANWTFGNYSTSASLNLTGLTAGTAYDWRISTRCLDGSTSALSQSQFTTSGTVGSQTRTVVTAGATIEKTEDKSGVILYPNPVGDQLTIQSGVLIRTVKLVSVSGQTISTHHGMNKQTLQVPVGRLTQGVYILKITTSDGKTSIHKIMKE